MCGCKGKEPFLGHSMPLHQRRIFVHDSFQIGPTLCHGSKKKPRFSNERQGKFFSFLSYLPLSARSVVVIDFCNSVVSYSLSVFMDLSFSPFSWTTEPSSFLPSLSAVARKGKNALSNELREAGKKRRKESFACLRFSPENTEEKQA